MSGSESQALAAEAFGLVRQLMNELPGSADVARGLLQMHFEQCDPICLKAHLILMLLALENTLHHDQSG